MNWNAIFSSTRDGQVQKPTTQNNSRTEFQKDYDRLIFSSPFRRLQNKTQVFPLPGKVFVHNRLTHSLEVASVGRSLGNLVAEKLLERGFSDVYLSEIGSIVSSACLAHDLGNPPFGHAGEEAVSSFFKKNSNLLKPTLSETEWADFVNFDGNANAFRLLTHQFNGRRPGGYRLTFSTLASIVKYPYEAWQSPKENKFGFFQSDKEHYLRLADELFLSDGKSGFKRYAPVYLVEAADDICYQLMDFEDAHKLGIIDTEEIKAVFFRFLIPDGSDTLPENIASTLDEVKDKNEQISYLRAIIINKLIEACSEAFVDHLDTINQGSPSVSLINLLPEHLKFAYNSIKKQAFNQIYKHKTVLEIELAGYQIIDTLMQEFIQAVLHPETSYSKKIIALMPQQYFSSDYSTYQRFLAVTDFISGMTDVYALDLYRILKGISIPKI